MNAGNAIRNQPGTFQKMDRRIAQWFKGWNPYDPSRLEPSDLVPVSIEDSATRRITFRVVFATLTGFFIWASVAPLDDGVMVTGSVIVQGHRKAVQHPQGGVVTDIFVREGQHVQEGQVLLKINPLSSTANLSQSEADYLNLMVSESRLVSERLGHDSIRWIPELAEWPADDPRMAQEKALQVQLFNTRRTELQTQQNILNEQLAAAQKQLVDLNEVLAIKRQQLAVVTQEAQSNRELAKDGFVSNSRANEVERSRSDLLASITNLGTEISRTQSAIASTRLQLLQLKNAFQKDVETRLTETQKNRRAYRDRVEALTFDRNLMELKAPISGTIVGLKVFTEGGVVRGSDVLMEVVPNEGSLIVEAQVPPQYIDKVRKGLSAFTRFTAFNLNTTPVVNGEVTLVAPDKMVAPDGRSEYYLSYVSLSESEIKRLGDVEIQPGMPVEVVVKTGERTFMSYLTKPLSDRLARSFKDPF